MATPLLAYQFDLDARPFTFCDRPAKSDDKSLNVREDDGGRCWPSKDGGKRPTLLCIHGEMLALFDSILSTPGDVIVAAIRAELMKFDSLII